MRHHPEHDEAMGQRLGSGAGYALSDAASEVDEDESMRRQVVDECMRKVADGLSLTEEDMKVLEVDNSFKRVKEGHMLTEDEMCMLHEYDAGQKHAAKLKAVQQQVRDGKLLSADDEALLLEAEAGKHGEGKLQLALQKLREGQLLTQQEMELLEQHAAATAQRPFSAP
jgi:hypothetical protein